jgi:hypothetical protein
LSFPQATVVIPAQAGIHGPVRLVEFRHPRKPPLSFPQATVVIPAQAGIHGSVRLVGFRRLFAVKKVTSRTNVNIRQKYAYFGRILTFVRTEQFIFVKRSE